ncbi:MAG: hypothetical protein KME13_24630 [Myxacorys californica WJT36-NPBG1]|jgi:hypothetical protein|nr:hypothetical protein [Myxacorys californica WJT36-NPBG1]
MSETVGSLNIELRLEKSAFDRDLQQLRSLKGGQIAFAATLDTRALRQQVNNLSQLKPQIQAQVAIANLNAVESQLKTLTRDRRVRVGIDLDTTGFEQLDARLGRIASRNVSINVQTNDAAIDLLNGKLNALTDRTISVGIAIDESGISALEKRLGQFGDRSFKVTAQVDDSRLTALNKHLDLKVKHFNQVNNLFKSSPLTPRVDFSGLDALDRRLGDFKNRSIDIKANISDVRQSITQLKQELSGIQIPVTVRTANGANASAAQTLTQKVAVDSSGIETAITKSLNSSFQGFEKNLEGAIGKIGKGNIFGGSASALTAPLKLVTGVLGNVFSGIGLGVGQQISKDLGTGISEGIDAQLAPIIGSFRLVGRELASSLTKELVDSLGQDAGLVQNVIQELVGKNNILVESGSVQSRQRQQQQSSTVEATRFYQAEAANADRPQIRAEQQKLAQQFATVQQLRDRTSQKTEVVANRLGAPQVKQNIEKAQAQLKDNQKTATELTKKIKAELAGIEASQQSLTDLKSSGTADAAQIAEVESSIAQKSTKLSQLQSELKSTSNSSKQVADRITRLTTSLGEINKTAESYFKDEVERIVEIEDKLAVAQRQLQQKLQPFEGLEALGLIRTPESIGAEIQTRKQSLGGLQQKQSALRESSRADAQSIDQIRGLRNRELQLPESEQDQAKIKSIEAKILQLQERQAQRKVLYENISEAIAREEIQLKSLAAQSAQPLAVKSKANGLTASLNQVIKEEQQTNQIIQDAIAAGDEDRARQLLRGRKQLQERQQAIREQLARLGVDAKTSATRAPSAPAPKVEGTQLATPLGKIVQEVAQIRGESVQAADVPKIVVSDEETTAKGRNAAFQSDKNSILLSSKLKSNLDQGTVSAEEFQTLVHEIEHAFQFDFGRKTRAQAAQSDGLLKPNADELKQFGYRIEGSAAGKGSVEAERQSRKLEADAYTFAARNAPKIQSAIKRDRTVTGFEDAVGIGGGKVDNSLLQAQLTGLKQLKAIAQSATVDLTEEFDAARA